MDCIIYWLVIEGDKVWYLVEYNIEVNATVYSNILIGLSSYLVENQAVKFEEI